MGKEKRNIVLREWRDYLEKFVGYQFGNPIHMIDLDRHNTKMKEYDKRQKEASS